MTRYLNPDPKPKTYALNLDSCMYDFVVWSLPVVGDNDKVPPAVFHIVLQPWNPIHAFTIYGLGIGVWASTTALESYTRVCGLRFTPGLDDAGFRF